MLKYKDKVLFIVVALVLGIVLGACGSSINSGNAASSVQPTNAVVSNDTNNGSNVSINNGASNNTNTNAGIAPAAANSGALNQTGGVLNPTGSLEVDVKSVVRAARPAVVLIAVTIQSNGNNGGIFGGGGGQIEQGVGTGSILTQDGFILTNNHVIEGANSIRVSVGNNVYAGKLIGREGTNSDLAIVKIDPKNGEKFPTIPLGDASKMEVGDFVVAIGNALGLPGGPSVTTGVVSNIGRSIQEPNGARLTNLIQTDAAINPGNSGGPLLNLRGEIIGINTAAAVNPEENVAAQNIGFAINVNQARSYADAWVTGKQPQATARPFMGILPQTMTAALAARYNIPAVQGVLIARVDNNTPAAKAGWKAGDVLIAMDNQPITSTDDLSAILDKHKAGDTSTAVLVGRDGSKRNTQITFGQSPTNP